MSYRQSLAMYQLKNLPGFICMSECNLLEKCLFFNDKLKSMPAASDTMKKLYCRWNFAKCARYKVAIAIGRKEVPPDLFPGDSQRANNMLLQYNK